MLPMVYFYMHEAAKTWKSIGISCLVVSLATNILYMQLEETELCAMCSVHQNIVMVSGCKIC